MYMEHDKASLPDELNMPIWRYMDFPKFVHLLDRQSLFFCRPDCFEDTFEGTWGAASYRTIEKDLRRKAAEVVNVIGGVEKSLEGIKRTSTTLRGFAAVNCWHLSQNESAAMWKLYMYSHQGIAIRSTTAKLIKSFSNDKKLLIHVGVVKYIDFETESIPFGNYFSSFMYKVEQRWQEPFFYCVHRCDARDCTLPLCCATYDRSAGQRSTEFRWRSPLGLRRFTDLLAVFLQRAARSTWRRRALVQATHPHQLEISSPGGGRARLSSATPASVN